MDPNSHKVLLFKVVLSPAWPEYLVPWADCWDAAGRWCFCGKSVQVSAPLHTQPFPSPLNLLSPPSLPFLHGATGIAFCYWLWWAASPFPGPTVTGSSLVVDQLQYHLGTSACCHLHGGHPPWGASKVPDAPLLWTEEHFLQVKNKKNPYKESFTIWKLSTSV